MDVERVGGGLLRVTIDRVPGHVYTTGESEFVLVEDCEAVTRQLQYVLEVENADYSRLEVSSPGLDRPLRGERDFRRFAGDLRANGARAIESIDGWAEVNDVGPAGLRPWWRH